MKLKWHGQTFDVDLETRSNSPLGAGVAIWAPGDYPTERRERWIADQWLVGTGHSVQVEGDTAQAALDALAMLVPAPMVRGGEC